MYYTDQLGNNVHLPDPPQRIVSLVPSQTELLYALGLEEEVVGITKFCVHPSAWFRSKTRVGGTKKLHADIIRGLRPDLIIANKEENLQEEVMDLMADFPVWVSNIQSLADAVDMIARVGSMTRRESAAQAIVAGIGARFAQLVPAAKPVHTAYFIWRDPWMVAGGDTFIHQMLQACGFLNVFADMSRYPVVKPEQLAAADCRLVLLSSEPYPFREKHITEIQAHVPEAKIMLVDGEMFSWYGSRLLEAPAYFQEVINAL